MDASPPTPSSNSSRFHMERFAPYRGRSIDATPVNVRRLYRSSAVIERLVDGERFIFSDLGDRGSGEEPQAHALEWTRHWIHQ